MKLEDIEKLCSEATPEPWTWGGHGDSIVGTEYFSDGSGQGEITIIETDSRVYPPNDKDAKFIMAARELMPKLVSRIRELEAEREKLLAIAKAAKNLEFDYFPFRGIEQLDELKKALEELEKST